jgi:hypothetical protein
MAANLFRAIPLASRVAAPLSAPLQSIPIHIDNSTPTLTGMLRPLWFFVLFVRYAQPIAARACQVDNGAEQVARDTKKCPHAFAIPGDRSVRASQPNAATFRQDLPLPIITIVKLKLRYIAPYKLGAAGIIRNMAT